MGEKRTKDHPPSAFASGIAEPEKPRTGDGEFTLQLVETVREFERLKSDWLALHDESGITPFQSYEYQRAWWRYFGEANPHACLHIVVLRRDGQVVMIAPCFLETVSLVGRVGLRRLAFLGRQVSDYLDLLIAGGEERLCINLLASHLAKHTDLFDVILLEDIPDPSPTHMLLFEALNGLGLSGKRFVTEQCPRTQLLGTWKDTLASFKIDRRREINRRERNLTNRHTVAFELAEHEEDLAADMDEFIAMHQHRWTGAGHEGVFADPRTAALHREVAHAFFRRGWLFLAFLRVDGKRVVANYCYKFRSDLLFYLGGATDLADIRQLSPGRVLIGFCIQEAIEQKIRVFDFMRGTEQYKYEFNALDTPNWTVLLSNPASRFVMTRVKIDLLQRSLRSRIKREGLLWRYNVATHGLFSGTALDYLIRRTFATIRDAWHKTRAPETPLHLRGHDKKRRDSAQP